jgi:hypothetical protein
MWNTAPVIFEDEDEEALKANFIRLCVLYSNQPVFEVAAYVFRNQRDPELRSQQAAMIWQKDIEVQERIRQARLNGGEEPAAIATKEDKLRMLEAIFTNEQNKLPERIKAIELHAQIQGEIVKAIDKKITDNSRKIPRQIVFAQSND